MNNDSAEEKNKKKKKVKKKLKKAATLFKNYFKIAVKKNLELQIQEECEDVVKKTDEVTTPLQQSSSKVRVFSVSVLPEKGL